jgi:hypothetical protein
MEAFLHEVCSVGDRQEIAEASEAAEEGFNTELAEGAEKIILSLLTPLALW